MSKPSPIPSAPADLELIAQLRSRLQYAELRIRVLEEQLRLMRIDRYGAGGEKLSQAQMELFALEPTVSELTVQTESECAPVRRSTNRSAKHPGRQALPSNLPRVERVLPCTPDQRVCKRCGKETVVIGYEESSQLDVEPAKYFVLVTKREKRACRSCEELGVFSAPLPARIIEKCLASDRIVIDTVISKYCNHTPLHRQSMILERDLGLEISRATLDGWVLKVGELLIPMVAAMRRELISGSYIQADETPVDVQMHEGRGRNHQAYLWQYSRPGASVVFDFRLGRGRDGPKRFLGQFEGVLQTDGYTAYDQIGGTRMVHAACWAHARRQFFEAIQLNPRDPVATPIVARIDQLFAVDAAYTDHEIGRVIQAVEDMGKLDNTLIIYIVGDNGTSAEGTLHGTPNDLAAYSGIDIPVAAQMKAYDAWGSAMTRPHMSVAWAWAFDTPFKWTKQIASFFGGTRQGMAICWPGHIQDPGGIRTQFHHMIDIVPTLLEATGVQAPATVNGIAQRPIEGVSMAYTWNKANANAPSTRSTQYFEMLGNRAIYHDGWIAATVPPVTPWAAGLPTMPDVLTAYKWELYNIAEDYSENNDLAPKNPDKLRELQQLFSVEAKKYNVLPLANDFLVRMLSPRPNLTVGRDVFTFSGESSGLDYNAAPNILNKSYNITAVIEVPPGGGDGMLVTLGGRFGGYGLYLLKGKPVFTYNLMGLERFRWEGGEALAPGKHTVVFDFKRDEGPGFGKGGSGTLKVDGTDVATKIVPHTIPLTATADETFDVGVDTRTSVDDGDYQPPFRFNGTIEKITFKLIPPVMTAAEEKLLQQKTQEAKNKAQ